MDHEFSDEDQILRSDEELYALLKRLEPDRIEPIDDHHRDGHYHADDIAEALGISVEDVLRELQELRSEHRTAKLAGVLKELEEPLYRVERPSSTNEPKVDAVMRTRAARLLADRIQDKIQLPRRRAVEDQDEKAELAFGRKVLYALIIISLLLMWIGIMNMAPFR